MTMVELIESFTVVEPDPKAIGGQAAADQIAAAGYMGEIPPANPLLTDTVTPIRQPVSLTNQ